MRTKMIFLLFSVFFGSSVYSQIIGETPIQTMVQTTEVVALTSLHGRQDLGVRFTRQLNDSLKEKYPSILESVSVMAFCQGDSVEIKYEARLYESDQIDADYTVVSAGFAAVKQNAYLAQKLAVKRTHKQSAELEEKVNKTYQDYEVLKLMTGDSVNDCPQKGIAVVQKFIVVKKLRARF